MLGDSNLGRAGEHQRNAPVLWSLGPGAWSRKPLRIFGEVIEQRVAALVPVHAAEIQDVGLGDRQRPQDRGVRCGGRRIQAHPDDRRGLQRRGRARLDQRRFLRREEDVAGGRTEVLLEHVEVEGAVLLRGRHQHGAVGDERQAEVARAVAEGPEQHQVVVASLGAKVLEQIWNVGTVGGEPRLLAFGRRRAVEDLVAEIGEGTQLARLAHGEAPHAHAVLHGCRLAGRRWPR